MVVPIKFEGGVSVTFLRKRQLFTKKRRTKIYNFKKGPIFENISKPAIWKGQTILLEKVPLFFDSIFLTKGIDNTPSNLT
jgi:hypothetical protein